MYIIRNAWKSIKRNKGRNILIGIILVVIACTCTISLAIKTSADSLIKSYKAAYKAEASIGFDRKEMMESFDLSDDSSREDMKEQFSEIEQITVEDAQNYGDSQYVTSYYYTNSISLNSNSLEAATSDFGGQDSEGMSGGAKEEKKEDTGDFTLTGYSSADSMEEFIDGSYTMSETSDDAWEQIFDGNYCFINEELAELNEIEIGDTIRFVSPQDEDIKFSYQVVGIFKENSSEEASNGGFQMFSNSANTIITNAAAVSAAADKDTDLVQQVTPHYFLTSLEDAEAFEEELYSKGLDESFSVTTNEDQVENATSAISNISGFAVMFLVIILAIGAVILFVINMLNVRERKYEIGVLRTIGMKKTKLAAQFVSELLIITICALIVGGGIGACLSKPVGNFLLKSEISQSQENRNDMAANFGGESQEKRGGNRGGAPNLDFGSMQGSVNVEEFDSIDAVVNIKVIGILFAIGLALTLVSSFAAIFSIQRFSPLKILQERS